MSVPSDTSAGEGAQRTGWFRAVLVYRDPKVLAMLFLGFSAGLPFMLVFSTLSAWLRQAGIERTAIGMLSWVGLVFTLKFFWAPIVDRLPLPWLLIPPMALSRLVLGGHYPPDGLTGVVVGTAVARTVDAVADRTAGRKDSGL